MDVCAVTGSAGRRFAHYALAGTIGSVIVKGATALAPRVAPTARRAAVHVLAAGIVAGRRIGEATEEARLKAGDIMAEAHASLGEPAPPPAREANAAHGHEH